MTLAAGPLNQRVQIQQRLNSTQNELGENITPWTTLATVWARAEPLRGREYFAAGQQQQALDVRFVIRYRSDVDATMRVLWRGQPHDIVGQPINVDGRREMLEIMAVAGVRDGR